MTAVLLLFPLLISAQVRTERLLETGWKFTREDSQQFSYPDYDDSGWQTVRIPHDWAIYGPFSINNDKQMYGQMMYMTGDPRRFGRVYFATGTRGVFWGDPV